jgi:hypothetical protein
MNQNESIVIKKSTLLKIIKVFLGLLFIALISLLGYKINTEQFEVLGIPFKKSGQSEVADDTNLLDQKENQTQNTSNGSLLPTYTAYPTYTSFPTQTPYPTTTKTSIPTNTKQPPATSTLVSMTPLRPHVTTVVGTGIFEVGSFSDSQYPLSANQLYADGHMNIQRIRQEEQPSGCDVSRYKTNYIWISGSKGMKITINGKEVGQYLIDPNPLGYIFEYPIEFGDQICAVGYNSSGFAIFLGPDIYYHYDSYCYRENCY